MSPAALEGGDEYVAGALGVHLYETVDRFGPQRGLVSEDDDGGLPRCIGRGETGAYGAEHAVGVVGVVREDDVAAAKTLLD